MCGNQIVSSETPSYFLEERNTRHLFIAIGGGVVWLLAGATDGAKKIYEDVKHTARRAFSLGTSAVEASVSAVMDKVLPESVNVAPPRLTSDEMRNLIQQLREGAQRGQNDLGLEPPPKSSSD